MKKLKKGQIRSKKQNNKIKCEGCGKKKRSRTVIKFKGKQLCGACMNKYRIGNIDLPSRNSKQVSFKEAINKIYEIKGYKCKNHSIIATCSFPTILIGQRIKIIQEEDEENKEILKKELKKYKIKCVDLMLEIDKLRRRS
jgi:hypothetical protein